MQRINSRLEDKTINHEGHEVSRRILLYGFPSCDFGCRSFPPENGVNWRPCLPHLATARSAICRFLRRTLHARRSFTNVCSGGTSGSVVMGRRPLTMESAKSAANGCWDES